MKYLSDIRWRKGLFRLWSVLAILWIIGSASFVLLVEEIPSLPKSSSIAEAITLARNQHSKTSEVSEQIYKSALSLAKLRSISSASPDSDIQILTLSDGRTIKTSTNQPPQKLEDRILKEIYIPERNTGYKFLLALALIPPVILLVLGALIIVTGSWVLNGFRPSKA